MSSINNFKPSKLANFINPKIILILTLNYLAKCSFDVTSGGSSQQFLKSESFSGTIKLKNEVEEAILAFMFQFSASCSVFAFKLDGYDPSTSEKFNSEAQNFKARTEKTVDSIRKRLIEEIDATLIPDIEVFLNEIEKIEKDLIGYIQGIFLSDQESVDSENYVIKELKDIFSEFTMKVRELVDGLKLTSE